MLKLIRGFFCLNDLNNDKMYAVISSLKNLLYLYQKSEVTNDEYLKEFKAKVESMDDYQACILEKFSCLVQDKMVDKFDEMMDKATQGEIEECKKAVKKTMAALFFPGADKIGYGGLKITLVQMSMEKTSIHE